MQQWDDPYQKKLNQSCEAVAIGFVSDHLEILFDIDIEAKELAGRLGLNLRRTEMPNASPTFVDALADLVTNGTGTRIADLDQTRMA